MTQFRGNHVQFTIYTLLVIIVVDWVAADATAAADTEIYRSIGAVVYGSILVCIAVTVVGRNL